MGKTLHSRPRNKGLNFKISSGLKDIIGRNLITNDNIAVFELVKNAYDAHATKVEITFENIYATEATIVIKDNGKGMTYADLRDKWLFVAYSAKKEGTEDNDYRSKIHQSRIFAGEKGIGRFSCDRLGTFLELETIKDAKNSKKEILQIDWTKFEESLKDEFINIEVSHHSRRLSPRDKHGTRLIISGLRSPWNRDKLLYLKKSLSKLINPEGKFSSKKFQIYIHCPDEFENDQKELEDHNKINGPIENFIFEELEIKTTTISVEIDSRGENITTELKDGGTLIYRIKEKSHFKRSLSSIRVKVFYLNKSAKSTFKRRMGVATIAYGSIFVYRNNIRIFPYGEPDEDSFNLNRRKAQKPSVYLGNKDLIGRIEIAGTNEQFRETSSRGDGFIKNETYNQFAKFFEEFVIKRLERYVIDVQKWGEESLSIEDENLGESKAVLQERITSLISRLSNSNDIIEFEYDQDILNILDEKQAESASALVTNLFKIAKASSNNDLLRIAEKTKIRVQQMRTALLEAKNESEKKANEIEQITTENIFLRSIKSQDLDQVVNLMHHIGISSGIIEGFIKGLVFRIEKKIHIPDAELRDVLLSINAENNKILSISRFATKANFKINAASNYLDLTGFIQEYIINVARPYQLKDINLRVKNNVKDGYYTNFRPLEITMMIDNLISNSIKAEAKNLEVTMERSSSELHLKFSDDGLGIPKLNLPKIFQFGFTTTKGSGLGLAHIKEIVEKLGGTIEATSNGKKGSQFTINI